MSTSVRFMKDLLTKKKRLKEQEIVELETDVVPVRCVLMRNQMSLLFNIIFCL